MNNLISIGKILNFHGIKGEVKVGFTKGKEEQIQNLEIVYICPSDLYKQLHVESVRFHKQFALIKFKEINSINEVESIKGLEIKISKDEAEKSLKEDEFFIDDLIGLSVLNKDDEKIGQIVNIGSNGASEIIELKDANGKIHLIPFVKELVPIIDLTKKIVVINDIEGLIE